MSDFMKILKERRSVRKYEDRQIPEDVLNTIYESVQWSPSWANSQCWEIVNVKDETLRKKLQETMSAGNPSTKAIVNAPVLLAICGKKGVSGFYDGKVSTKLGEWMMFDLGIATQSLCLCAKAHGIGSVVVGLYDIDKAAEVIKLPEGYELVALIPMGYPIKQSKGPKRKEIDEFVRIDTF